MTPEAPPITIRDVARDLRAVIDEMLRHVPDGSDLRARLYRARNRFQIEAPEVRSHRWNTVSHVLDREFDGKPLHKLEGWRAKLALIWGSIPERRFAHFLDYYALPEMDLPPMLRDAMLDGKLELHGVPLFKSSLGTFSGPECRGPDDVIILQRQWDLDPDVMAKTLAAFWSLEDKSSAAKFDRTELEVMQRVVACFAEELPTVAAEPKLRMELTRQRTIQFAVAIILYTIAIFLFGNAAHLLF